MASVIVISDALYFLQPIHSIAEKFFEFRHGMVLKFAV